MEKSPHDMKTVSNQKLRFAYCMAVTAAVFVFAYWDGLTNRCVVMDDVRQQIYWMQQWNDPALFQNDLLTDYAKNYVPWSVKAIYRAGSLVMNPVQFTKVVTAILFLVTAGFLFGLAMAFEDDLTPVFVVCVYLFFGAFMRKISGGLSQGFAFPLLTAYLYFLSRKSLVGTGTVAFLAALFTPYIFLICLGTQTIFLLHQYWREILELLRRIAGWLGISIPGLSPSVASSSGDGPAGASPGDGQALTLSTIVHSRLFAGLLLLVAGCLAMAVQYVFVDWTAFGKLVTWQDMVGKPEYSEAGRYQIYPIPSLLYEIISPWIFDLPFIQWGIVGGWLFVPIGVAVLIYACAKGKWDVNLSGFKVFAYLFPASLILYVLACIFVFRLFVPRRYVEFSLNIFYCVGFGVALRVAVGTLVSRRVAFPVVTTLLAILAALRLYHVGLYDYTQQERLYHLLETTPRSSLMAGHPDLMDNVVTFAGRKAFVTYKLSHTWYKDYWATIKQRTFDFFRAYYASDPEEIHAFCRENGIDFILVRDKDFSPETLKQGKFYFEPFNTYIRDLVKDRSKFAILDGKQFPPLFVMDGVRVIPCQGPPSRERGK